MVDWMPKKKESTMSDFSDNFPLIISDLTDDSVKTNKADIPK